MKIAFATVTLLCLASPALAIARYNSTGMTCAAVQQSIANEKAVLLRYRSASGNVLYDRYVTDRNQCDSSSYAASAYVPTKDNPSCPVHNCRSVSLLEPR